MYSVELIGPEVTAAVEALPADLLAAFAELRTALELAPWSVGRPYVPTTPHGSRTVAFGADSDAFLLFMISDHDQVVTIVQITVL